MAIEMNNHVFKGHRTMLGSKFVTYKEIKLAHNFDIYPKSKRGFDWGTNGSSALQLSFSILRELTSREEAESLTIEFCNKFVSKLNNRDWLLTATEVTSWIKEHNSTLSPKREDITQDIFVEKHIMVKRVIKSKPKTKKTNIVKEICKDLGITQKNLAEILEVPEGTVSSWAVKNEIPRLGKKAIEFYKQSIENQKIVDSYKNFVTLLNVS